MHGLTGLPSVATTEACGYLVKVGNGVQPVGDGQQGGARELPPDDALKRRIRRRVDVRRRLVLRSASSESAQGANTTSAFPAVP